MTVKTTMTPMTTEVNGVTATHEQHQVTPPRVEFLCSFTGKSLSLYYSHGAWVYSSKLSEMLNTTARIVFKKQQN